MFVVSNGPEHIVIDNQGVTAVPAVGDAVAPQPACKRYRWFQGMWLLPVLQVNPMGGPLISAPPDAIDKILDINIKAALLLVQQAVPHMKRGGRIVLISSVTAFQ